MEMKAKMVEILADPATAHRRRQFVRDYRQKGDDGSPEVGAQTLLTLRSLIQSERWERAWSLLLAT